MVDPAALKSQACATKSLTYAFYTLCALLEGRGLIEPGELGANLRRLRGIDDDELRDTLEAIAANLDANPFGAMGTLSLQVITGGKEPTDE